MLRQNKNLCIIISSESNLYVRIKNDMLIAYVSTYLQGRTENSGNYAFVYILKKGLMERMEFTCSSSSLILFLKRLRGGVWNWKQNEKRGQGNICRRVPMPILILILLCHFEPEIPEWHTDGWLDEN